MPRSRRRQRLGNIGLVALAALTLGGVGYAFADGMAASKPAPVSPQVQQYYDENVASAKATMPTAPAPSGTATAKQVTDQLNGQKVNLWLAPKSNGKLVIAAHGHGGNVSEWTNGKQQQPMLDALIDAGYSVAASDAHFDAWGNAQSVQDYKDLDAWAKTKSAFTDVVLLGQSMGGLPALQLLTELPDAKAFVGVYPVCDLGTVAPRFADTAKAWPQGAAGHLSPVDLKGVTGKRMIFFASPGDTVVPKASNTDACAQAAKSAGTDVQVVQVTGDHGDQSAFQPATVVRFLANAGR